MDRKEFNDRVARLQEVSKIVEQLPVEIRASSFALLQEYIAGEASVNSTKANKHATSKENPSDLSSRNEFLSSHDHEKPSDNVYLLIAALYRDYGTEPFTIKEITDLASDTGVTIPLRVDKTIKVATFQNKKLFVSTGSRGYYKPTVHGEQYLKDTYNISKGTNKKTTIE